MYNNIQVQSDQWQNAFDWKTKQECGEFFKKWSLFQSVHDNFMVVEYVETK